MIGRVMHSVAENDSRPNLCGAFFKIDGARLQVVSCDSYTLSECSKVCEINSIGEVQEEHFSFILPGHALNEITKILSDKKGAVQIYLARKHAILKTEGLVFFTRLIDGDYFDYQRIIPKEQTVFVKCSRDRLLSGLERALLVADEKVQGSGRNYVKLEIKGNTFSMTSSSSTGRVYDEMSCEHEGEDLVIGFNCRYLINSVRVADAEELLLSFKSSNQAMTISAAEEKEDQKFFYLILPVRMSD
jgi:DNA polymerase-3 subunit beta